MQYILSQEEYNNLTNYKSALEQKNRAELQALCTKIAQNMPVTTVDFWGKESTEKHTWGCVLTRETDYCDECPVKGICPHPYKEWSK